MPTTEINEPTEQFDEDEPYGVTTRAAKRRCLFGLLLLAVVAGVLDQLLDYKSADRILTFVYSIIGIVLVAMWCQYDSRERSYTIRKPLRLLIIFLAFLGVPIYLLCTRGLRGLISTLLAVGFFGVLMGLEQLAIEITYRIQCLVGQ